jgi:hypothetical protein
MKLVDLKKGDRGYSLYDDGWHGSLIYWDVMRVNRVTVTIREESGKVHRVDPSYLDHKLTPAEYERSLEFFPMNTATARHT